MVQTFLKIAPSLHGDLAAIELSFVLNASPFDLLSCSLSGVAPAEIVKLPVCVDRKNEIPNW